MNRTQNTLDYLRAHPDLFATRDDTSGLVASCRMPKDYNNKKCLPWSEVKGRWFFWGERAITNQYAYLLEDMTIPAGVVVDITKHEPQCGYSTIIVVTTNDGVRRWQGCGHPRCEVCQYGGGCGVCDDAYRQFYDRHGSPARFRRQQIEARSRA